MHAQCTINWLIKGLGPTEETNENTAFAYSMVIITHGRVSFLNVFLLD